MQKVEDAEVSKKEQDELDEIMAYNMSRYDDAINNTLKTVMNGSAKEE